LARMSLAAARFAGQVVPGALPGAQADQLVVAARSLLDAVGAERRGWLIRVSFA
jgi:hypothetical protein